MKKKLSIASLVLITSCAAGPFPKETLYISHLTSQVCAEYEMVSVTEVTFRHVRDLPLQAGGPCDGLTGYTLRSFKKIQNWIRDSIKEQQ